jgi:hypothetical protein
VLEFRFCLDKTATDSTERYSYRTIHEVADRFNVSYEYIILLEEQEVKPEFKKQKLRRKRQK